MLNDISPGRFRKINIACGYTDLRYGVDGLARVIQEEFELVAEERTVSAHHESSGISQVNGWTERLPADT